MMRRTTWAALLLVLGAGLSSADEPDATEAARVRAGELTAHYRALRKKLADLDVESTRAAVEVAKAQRGRDVPAAEAAARRLEELTVARKSGRAELRASADELARLGVKVADISLAKPPAADPVSAGRRGRRATADELKAIAATIDRQLADAKAELARVRVGGDEAAVRAATNRVDRLEATLRGVAAAIAAERSVRDPDSNEIDSDSPFRVGTAPRRASGEDPFKVASTTRRAAADAALATEVRKLREEVAALRAMVEELRERLSTTRGDDGERRSGGRGR